MFPAYLSNCTVTLHFSPVYASTVLARFRARCLTQRWLAFDPRSTASQVTSVHGAEGRDTWGRGGPGEGHHTLGVCPCHTFIAWQKLSAQREGCCLASLHLQFVLPKHRVVRQAVISMHCRYSGTVTPVRWRAGWLLSRSRARSDPCGRSSSSSCATQSPRYTHPLSHQISQSVSPDLIC